jgi:hypothetical protein
MWNEPSPGDLERIPRLYATDGVPWEDKLVHEHFFIGGCDWFVVEYDPGDRLFFGFAVLNGDLVNAEWGYVPLDELRSVRVAGIEVDRDLHWSPRPAGEVPLIRLAHHR